MKSKLKILFGLNNFFIKINILSNNNNIIYYVVYKNVINFRI